jgi:hypothetical protein
MMADTWALSTVEGIAVGLSLRDVVRRDDGEWVIRTRAVYPDDVAEQPEPFVTYVFTPDGQMAHRFHATETAARRFHAEHRAWLAKQL